jgi:tetratricopeptide (TPR) repeat protein
MTRFAKVRLKKITFPKPIELGGGLRSITHRDGRKDENRPISLPPRYQIPANSFPLMKGDTELTTKDKEDDLQGRSLQCLDHAHSSESLARGWNALKASHPDQALELLNQPGTLSRYADIDFARGEAYLAAKQPQAAETQFRKIVDHPYRDQSYISSVAWLELARALRTEGNRSAAKDAYVHFLELWQNADANAALLQAARREVATLN